MRRMYSQNELEKLVKDVFLADIESGEIDFPALISAGLESADLTDVDLVVKSIKQTAPSYSVEFEPVLDATSTTAGLTITNVYNKFVVIGNILYIVAINNITNPTASNITFNAGSNNISKSVSIDESIAELIYDIDGKKVSETGTGYIDIYAGSNGYEEGVSYPQFRSFLKHDNENKIQFMQQTMTTVTIQAGKTLQVFYRSFLILI